MNSLIMHSDFSALVICIGALTRLIRTKIVHRRNTLTRKS
jgi:hypothetical protein